MRSSNISVHLMLMSKEGTSSSWGAATSCSSLKYPAASCKTKCYATRCNVRSMISTMQAVCNPRMPAANTPRLVAPSYKEHDGTETAGKCGKGGTEACCGQYKLHSTHLEMPCSSFEAAISCKVVCKALLAAHCCQVEED